MNRRDLLQAIAVTSAAIVTAAGMRSYAADLPPATKSTLAMDSVYHLATPLTDQSGRAFTLGDGRGAPTIVSMFYTSCQMVCPMQIEAIRATLQPLAESERQRVKVLMVSFDPEKDTVAVLQKTARQRELDPTQWTLARTDAKHVRKLASVLGVQYKALPNGEFNHSTSLILLDAEGLIAGRTSQLGQADPAFVKLVKNAAIAAAH